MLLIRSQPLMGRVLGIVVVTGGIVAVVVGITWRSYIENMVRLE